MDGPGPVRGHVRGEHDGRHGGTGVGSPTVAYRSFGTTVTVLPVVMGNGKIHLDVAPVLSNRNDANGLIRELRSRLEAFMKAAP